MLANWVGTVDWDERGVVHSIEISWCGWARPRTTKLECATCVILMASSIQQQQCIPVTSTFIDLNMEHMTCYWRTYSMKVATIELPKRHVCCAREITQRRFRAETHAVQRPEVLLRRNSAKLLGRQEESKVRSVIEWMRH